VDTVLCVDEQEEALNHERDTNPPLNATPINLAYVIYTSGSTGNPKGAMIHHRGLVNYLSWCTQAYKAREGSGAPVHSPLGFDLTVTSLYLPLLTGGAVRLLGSRDGVEELSRVLEERNNFSLVKITPAHLDVLGQLFTAHDGNNTTNCLVVGGEALRGESLEWWRLHAPQVRVVNEYGPTETVVGCCVSQVTAGEIEPGMVPIGRPIANTQLYVLDQDLQPVAPGINGELFIGGDGLARGYLGRPGLTAERFIPHPYSNRPGALLYRTGDVVRHRWDGQLEYVGRVDQQVKVRGFRIELGEIETTLLSDPNVSEAAVLLRTDSNNEVRLVAYVVPKGDREVTAAELRTHLAAQLPDYMIPAAFVQLEEMPLTRNGKVDRRALPEPAANQDRSTYVAPNTEVEQMLAGIWAEVLKVERVGLTDNFFEMGGHSLLATRIISRLRELFGVDIPLRSLFEAPTVGGLAIQVESARRERLDTQMPPLLAQPRAAEQGMVLSFAQQRLWFLQQLEPRRSAYNVPVATRLGGPLNVAALEQALNGLVQRHEVFRTRFPPVNGQPQQFVTAAELASVPIIELNGLSADSQKRVVRNLTAAAAQRPFDLKRDLLLRAQLVRLSEQEHLLLLVMHHIAADGWSMDVLVRDLAAHYQPYVDGVPLSLSPLTIQYADFAVWQRQIAESALRDEQMTYWKQQLQEPIPQLDLPLDYERPRANSYRGAAVRFRVNAELTEDLRRFSRREGVTLYMTLLAAFNALLCRYTGQTDLIVGTPVAQRERVETEALIGCSLNTLALRTDLSGNPNWEQMLQRVREVVLSGHAHAEVPFELVVDAVQPERRSNLNPLFQVWFVLLNVDTSSLGGLEIEPVEVDTGSSQFDLVLSVQERKDELHCEFTYSTDVLAAETMETMGEHYRNLLESMVDGQTSWRILDVPLAGAILDEQHAPSDVVITPSTAEAEYAF
jgi:amino acid adenylation domain-containing protein